FGSFDDGSALVSLPFPLTFYGITYQEMYVGTNGYITFGAGDTNFFPDVTIFASGQPRVAALFRDWVTDQDPAGAGIYYNASLPDRVIVTWKQMRPFGEGGGGGGGEELLAAAAPDGIHRATFQVVLFADGRVQIGYDGVLTRDGIVGISAGGETAVPQELDFSSSPAIAVDGLTAPYQHFLGFPDRPFDLDHTLLAFDPDGQGGYGGIVQVPIAPPTVAITSPAETDVLVEGQQVTIAADASDDVLVSEVVFTVNG